MNDTIDYYDRNADDFVKNTADIEFSAMQDMFLSELKEGAFILDFGCGSGRDAKCFLQRGYQVTALDGSAELCRKARENIGMPVMQMDFILPESDGLKIEYFGHLFDNTSECYKMFWFQVIVEKILSGETSATYEEEMV